MMSILEKHQRYCLIDVGYSKAAAGYIAEQGRAMQTASQVKLCRRFDKLGREDGGTRNDTDCSNALIMFWCCTCTSLPFAPGARGGYRVTRSAGFDKE